MPEVNHVIVYQDEASARQITQILSDFEITFESAVVWEAGKAAKALARIGVLQRLGYPASGLAKRLTDVVTVARVPGPIEHRVRYYLNFVDKLGGDVFVRGNFEHAALPIPPAKPRIIIAPLSEYGSAYQWPVERFIDLMDAMDASHPGINWEILGSGAEQDQTDARMMLETLTAGKARNLPGKLNLVKVMETLSRSSAMLACDGEIAHIAAHIGLPAAVIFGPNEPEWKRPLGKQSLVIREHVACSPCYLDECPLDHRCQHEVSVEQVVNSLQEALKLRLEA
jgi:ADP-heptose:LPS heptosyltransferase